MTERREAVLRVTYERPLTADELADRTARHPEQIHWAPNADGVTAYWFEATAVFEAT